MKVQLLSITNMGEKICEFGARTCYDSGAKTTEESYKTLLSTLLKSGHLSVFEHASASFDINGISRAASHQLVRHRLSSFSQRSQRYVNENAFEYVVPHVIEDNPDAKKIYDDVMENINEAYNKLITLGVKKEDARFLLPNAASTSLVMTANFRQWLHVIDMRVSRGAQWEIRELLTLIWKELYQQAPSVFGSGYFSNWSKDADYKMQIFNEKIK